MRNNNHVFVAFAEGDISELSTLCPTECKYHYSMFVYNVCVQFEYNIAFECSFKQYQFDMRM